MRDDLNALHSDLVDYIILIRTWSSLHLWIYFLGEPLQGYPAFETFHPLDTVSVRQCMVPDEVTLTLGKDLRRHAGEFVGQRIQEFLDGRCDIGTGIIRTL